MLSAQLFSALKMEVAHFSEIIVYFYQIMLLPKQGVTLNSLYLCIGSAWYGIATEKALFVR